MKIQWARTVRTVVAVLIGLVPIAPALVGELGLSTTVGVGAAVIAASGIVTRLMQIPSVDARLMAWLRVK